MRIGQRKGWISSDTGMMIAIEAEATGTDSGALEKAELGTL